MQAMKVAIIPKKWKFQCLFFPAIYMSQLSYPAWNNKEIILLFKWSFLTEKKKLSHKKIYIIIYGTGKLYTLNPRRLLAPTHK